MAKHLTLKDMIDGSGCTARTVRYYEREGLLRAARTSGGHRLFTAAELERLRFIICLREAGWTLEEVTELLDVRGQGDADARACTKLDTMIELQLARLERKIAVLVQLREDLTQTQQLLPVCHECTAASETVECSSCGRVPELARLPRSFKLVWRARELAAGFDDPAADAADDAPADDALADDPRADDPLADDPADEALQ
jgi:DNA-binding transcriptional MerR regulator